MCGIRDGTPLSYLGHRYAALGPRWSRKAGPGELYGAADPQRHERARVSGRPGDTREVWVKKKAKPKAGGAKGAGALLRRLTMAKATEMAPFRAGGSGPRAGGGAAAAATLAAAPAASGGGVVLGAERKKVGPGAEGVLP